MPTMLYTCQNGYEAQLQEELGLYGVECAGKGVGWATSPEPCGEDLCFAHLALANPRTISGTSLNSQAGEISDFFLAAVRETRFETNWPLVTRVAGDAPGLARRAGNLAKEIRRRLKKKASRIERLASSDMPKGSGLRVGLFIHLADDHLLCATNGWSGGQRRMADDPEAPSRSYLKVEEAYSILNVQPQSGETVVDLGAAPGGWSYSAAKRGASVTAIDNGSMKAGAAEHPMIKHLRDDAFKFVVRDGETFDWLFCDLVEEPHHVMRMIRTWLENKWCRRFVINLKFGRANAVQLLQEVRGPSGLAPSCRTFLARHLFHDREEFTLIGET